MGRDADRVDVQGRGREGRPLRDRAGLRPVRPRSARRVPRYRGRRSPCLWTARVDAVRDILTTDGRTLTQGALAWLWARSPHTVPIPGFRSVAQAEENAGALDHGPLRPEQLAEIDKVLSRQAD
ncbi:aldo/keto reductase [Streptomyces lunaelactis]|nr:aldo/keto reductase [Streptomyces lunaelactis]NUK19989.1 aldo/keto reductase [Streptomyces lunaelactis]NUK25666.1 aldo/keto reductase [Streptomyces lunaelactis]NUK54765.1 aldo/keto reductase [Streptomyces lunaelactis]NUK60037.1 aldo/keto reductase [Streptomyces lunaelactis]